MSELRGNNRSAYSVLGAQNYALTEREVNDYYATEPKALELLLDIETFNENIWECACGEGHLSKVLEQHGYNVISTDIIERGYGGVVDFLKWNGQFDGDIITNPPYKHAQEFVEHALDVIPTGNKVAMFLKIQFLESKARRELFNKQPPAFVIVSSSRLQCARNGDFETYRKGTGTAICYAWFIWIKGHKAPPQIKWFN